MPFTIIRNDITKMNADVIVNAANTELRAGGGVCGAIFTAAGVEKLQKACDKLSPIMTGDAVITKGYSLPAKYVIHAAGPVYKNGENDEERLLKSCYTNALNLAKKHKCTSIAFPLISAGIYGYPKDEALSVATSAIKSWLMEADMDVSLVVFDKTAFALSKELLGSVKSFINENYVDERNLRFSRERNQATNIISLHEVSTAAADRSISLFSVDEFQTTEKSLSSEKVFDELDKSALPTVFEQDKINKSYTPMATPMFAQSFTPKQEKPKKSKKPDGVIVRLDETFSATLLRLIDAKGKTDVEIYKRANLDRKLFSKIRKGKGYMPSKKTAVALSVALELSLPETRDLLERAGFALSRSVVFDVIIEYFITQRKYDIFEVNNVLFEYDQTLLGG